MPGKYSLTRVPLKGRKKLKVYASPKVGNALQEVVDDMSLYKAVKLSQVFSAVYAQGRKDGARDAFDALDRGFADVKRAIPHRNPGRPKKRKH